MHEVFFDNWSQVEHSTHVKPSHHKKDTPSVLVLPMSKQTGKKGSTSLLLPKEGGHAETRLKGTKWGELHPQ